jgi:phospholipid transport system substrate-binding protein
MKIMVAALVLILAALFPPAAQPQERDAMTTVQAHVDSVLKALRNPALSTEQKRAKVKSEADVFFDFVELSKRTLGLNWNRFNMEQRKEFVRLYKKRLEDTYMDRITAYQNEKVVFTSAVPLDGNTVEVRSQVMAKSGPASINYRVIKEGGGWKVYDVVIEGVSLIANYRSQFREILVNQSPEALLDTLRGRKGGQQS